MEIIFKIMNVISQYWMFWKTRRKKRNHNTDIIIILVYCWPSNNPVLNCTGPLICGFFSSNPCAVFNPHLGIWECEGQLYVLTYTVWHRGLEHQRFWYPWEWGVSWNQIPMDILRDNLSFVGSQKLYVDLIFCIGVQHP